MQDLWPGPHLPPSASAELRAFVLARGVAPGANLGIPGMREMMRSMENAVRCERASQSSHVSEFSKSKQRLDLKTWHRLRAAHRVSILACHSVPPLILILTLSLTFPLLFGDYSASAALIAARQARDPARNPRRCIAATFIPPSQWVQRLSLIHI